MEAGAGRDRAQGTGTPWAARCHGAFNVASGVWPLVHLPSFEKVFGPKEDDWLVRTVAGLLVGVGWSQLRGAGTPEGREHARRVGIATAATLLAIDLVYVPRGRIRATYLLDAAAEAAWILLWSRRRAGRRSAARRPAGRR
ncbi:hypothetical protein HS048_16120 [Planomonospora sp. ID91781]|uniref:Uncharacterized protein n=1 Tax=Planomonospora sphaerica TaxID=161355 RepID=A0A161LA69_9ACTN|nr:hypothetical protein [Planomonospora sphaerica]MBG0822268.1 hypothetical protein [Planomonospora sp. ID91781]GAT64604.1 hypothetical protein PS9374_00234 [Planomonospora sphaerica]